MEISVRSLGNVGLFKIEGTVGEGAHTDLGNALVHFIERGQPRFVVDLCRAESLDSAAIGELVACLHCARDNGGDLKLLVRPQGLVHELLQVMRLDRVFQIFGDEGEASAAFRNALN